MGTQGCPDRRNFLRRQRAKGKLRINHVDTRKKLARRGRISTPLRKRASCPPYTVYGRRGTETTAPTLPVPGCTRTSRLSRNSRSCHPLYCSFYHNLFYFLFFQQYSVFFIVFAILSSFFPSFSLKRHFRPPYSPFSGMRFNFFWENIDKPSKNS